MNSKKDRVSKMNLICNNNYLISQKKISQEIDSFDFFLINYLILSFCVVFQRKPQKPRLTCSP